VNKSQNNPPPGAYLISGIVVAITGYINPLLWGLLIIGVLVYEFWHKKKYGKGLLD
jgi:hypothetical protein